jgi:transcriptional regulatory protein LevR
MLMTGGTGENPYEVERRLRIEKNRRFLRDLGIHIAALAIAPVKKQEDNGDEQQQHRPADTPRLAHGYYVRGYGQTH